MRLPVRPAAAVWQVHSRGVNNPRTPGPSDYVVVAVLQYSPTDAELVTTNAAHGEAPIRARIEVADWFPAEVKALAGAGAEGRAELSGERYPARAYLRSPYSDGSLTRIGNSNYFVLRLFTT